MLVAITCEAHGAGNYSAPFSVKEVASFEDAFRFEVNECTRKNNVLAKKGKPAGWGVFPLKCSDGTGDIDITYCDEPQYLVQVRMVGE